MMIVDVRKLNASGNWSGRLCFDYEAPAELIDIPFVHFSAPVRVEADYVLCEDDSLEVTGKVSYVLEGQCSRCLKDASQAVEGELSACFRLSPERCGRLRLFGRAHRPDGRRQRRDSGKHAARSLLRRELRGNRLSRLKPTKEKNI